MTLQHTHHDAEKYNATNIFPASVEAVGTPVVLGLVNILGPKRGRDQCCDDDGCGGAIIMWFSGGGGHEKKMKETVAFMLHCKIFYFKISSLGSVL